MKKSTELLLAVFMAFALAAGSGNNSGTSSSGTEPQSSENNTSTDCNTHESSTVMDNSQTGNNNEPSEYDSTNTMKAIVAYFSATNTTEAWRRQSLTVLESICIRLHQNSLTQMLL